MLPREVLNRWKEKYGIPIYQVYGSTEAGHITYSRIERESRSPCPSALPLASRKCMIVDPETLGPVRPRESRANCW